MYQQSWAPPPPPPDDASSQSKPPLPATPYRAFEKPLPPSDSDHSQADMDWAPLDSENTGIQSTTTTASTQEWDKWYEEYNEWYKQYGRQWQNQGHASQDWQQYHEWYQKIRSSSLPSNQTVGMRSQPSLQSQQYSQQYQQQQQSAQPYARQSTNESQEGYMSQTHSSSFHQAQKYGETMQKPYMTGKFNQGHSPFQPQSNVQPMQRMPLNQSGQSGSSQNRPSNYINQSQSHNISSLSAIQNQARPPFSAAQRPPQLFNNAQMQSLQNPHTIRNQPYQNSCGQQKDFSHKQIPNYSSQTMLPQTQRRLPVQPLIPQLPPRSQIPFQPQRQSTQQYNNQQTERSQRQLPERSMNQPSQTHAPKAGEYYGNSQNLGHNSQPCHGKSIFSQANKTQLQSNNCNRNNPSVRRESLHNLNRSGSNESCSNSRHGDFANIRDLNNRGDKPYQGMDTRSSTVTQGMVKQPPPLMSVSVDASIAKDINELSVQTIGRQPPPTPHMLLQDSKWMSSHLTNKPMHSKPPTEKAALPAAPNVSTANISTTVVTMPRPSRWDCHEKSKAKTTKTASIATPPDSSVLSTKSDSNKPANSDPSVEPDIKEDKNKSNNFLTSSCLTEKKSSELTHEPDNNIKSKDDSAYGRFISSVPPDMSTATEIDVKIKSERDGSSYGHVIPPVPPHVSTATEVDVKIKSERDDSSYGHVIPPVPPHVSTATEVDVKIKSEKDDSSYGHVIPPVPPQVSAATKVDVKIKSEKDDSSYGHVIPPVPPHVSTATEVDVKIKSERDDSSYASFIPPVPPHVSTATKVDVKKVAGKVTVKKEEPDGGDVSHSYKSSMVYALSLLQNSAAKKSKSVEKKVIKKEAVDSRQKTVGIKTEETATQNKVSVSPVRTVQTVTKAQKVTTQSVTKTTGLAIKSVTQGVTVQSVTRAQNATVNSQQYNCAKVSVAPTPPAAAPGVSLFSAGVPGAGGNIAVGLGAAARLAMRKQGIIPPVTPDGILLLHNAKVPATVSSISRHTVSTVVTTSGSVNSNRVVNTANGALKGISSLPKTSVVTEPFSQAPLKPQNTSSLFSKNKPKNAPQKAAINMEQVTSRELNSLSKLARARKTNADKLCEYESRKSGASNVSLTVDNKNLNDIERRDDHQKRAATSHVFDHSFRPPSPPHKKLNGNSQNGPTPNIPAVPDKPNIVSPMSLQLKQKSPGLEEKTEDIVITPPPPPPQKSPVLQNIPKQPENNSKVDTSSSQPPSASMSDHLSKLKELPKYANYPDTSAMQKKLYGMSKNFRPPDPKKKDGKIRDIPAAQMAAAVTEMNDLVEVTTNVQDLSSANVDFSEDLVETLDESSFVVMDSHTQPLTSSLVNLTSYGDDNDDDEEDEDNDGNERDDDQDGLIEASTSKVVDVEKELSRMVSGSICELCSVALTNDTQTVQHLSGKMHLKKVRLFFLQMDRLQKPSKKKKTIKPPNPTTPDEYKDDYMDLDEWSKGCSLCHKMFTSRDNAAQHAVGAPHARNIAKTKSSVETVAPKPVVKPPPTPKEMFKCDLCQVFVNSQENLDTHNLGTKHTTKLRQKQREEQLADNKAQQSLISAGSQCVSTPGSTQGQQQPAMSGARGGGSHVRHPYPNAAMRGNFNSITGVRNTYLQNTPRTGSYQHTAMFQQGNFRGRGRGQSQAW